MKDIECRCNKTLVWALRAALVAVVAVDFFLPRHHPHFFWDTVPGFYGLVGVAGAGALIVLAEVLAKAWLHKGEDYYDH